MGNLTLVKKGKKQKESENFSISITTRETVPDIPLKEIKEKILGKTYVLSLVFIGDRLSQKLNKKYRGKNKPTDILSFPLEGKEGEIFINLRAAKRKSGQQGKNFKSHLGFLFIHGLLHLKGLKHSSKMESEEKKFCRLFKL